LSPLASEVPVAIKAKCPNPTCGKVVSAADVHAGKKARCPACGGAVPLPGPPIKARKREPSVAANEDEQESDTQPDEEESPRTKSKKVESNLASVLLFVAGIVLIVLAAFAPLFPWLSISVKEGDADNSKKVRTITMNGMGAVDRKDDVKGTTQSSELSSSVRPEGRLILGSCIAVAVVLTTGFTLAVSGALQRKLSEQILNATLLAGLAWGILLTIWSLAWFWKVVTFSHALQKGLEEVRFGARTAEFTIRPFPGMGLFVVVLAGLFLAYLFSQVASRLNKLRKQMFLAEQMKGVSKQAVEKLYMGRKLLRIAEGVGVLLGGLILVLLVRPWEAETLWKALEAMIRQQ
jgi:membrane protease YdiL (CAAX protease family)